MNDISGFRYVSPEPNLLPERLSPNAEDGFVAALTSGGDNRLAVDPHTGVNKYGCPPRPASGLVCASSCTAAPIAARGFQKAAAFYSKLVSCGSPLKRAEWTGQYQIDLAAGLLRYFGISGIAEAILCPSGTDALSTAAAMLARERPGEAVTAILPVASETGAGVPLAAEGRWFDGLASSGTTLLPAFAATTTEVSLRSADGTPRSGDEVADAFAAASAAAPGRAIVYLTHGTKTGLIAPVEPPPGIDVIVDASQGRIESFTVARFIRRGWPVVVTGSKFLGGPPFAGAVLFPTARLPHALSSSCAVPVNLGMVLRWIAAMDVIEDFAASASGMAALLRDRAVTIDRGICANPALVKVPGLEGREGSWSDLPGIFTFAVRDPADRRRLLSATALRVLYERLRKHGILLGQPVDLGQFGGLRIAVSARDLLAGARDDGGLPEIFAALDNMTCV